MIQLIRRLLHAVVMYRWRILTGAVGLLIFVWLVRIGVFLHSMGGHWVFENGSIQYVVKF